MPTALFSLTDKRNAVEFAQALHKRGWDFLSTGGTGKQLKAAGIPVRDIADIVGEEVMDGRVKTLSREIHGGLLARETIMSDMVELERMGAPFIDMVVVNFYELAKAIAKPGATNEEVTEATDIGGPGMRRSGAKGKRILPTGPDDYDVIIKWLDDGLPNKAEFIAERAADAEGSVADYALTSARYQSGGKWSGMIGKMTALCAYGQNRWQKFAALFSTGSKDPLAIERFKILRGTPTRNSVKYLERMLQTMTHAAAGFHTNYGKVPYMAFATKHGNCCGAAYGDDPVKVLLDMIRGDTLAIHGGFIMVNFPMTEELTEVLLHTYTGKATKRLIDGVVAPAFEGKAVENLKRKDEKCKVWANPALTTLDTGSIDTAHRYEYVRGGFIEEENYTHVLDLKNPKLRMIPRQVSVAIESDMIFAGAVGCTSSSNTITLVRGGMLIANGVAQQDRVGAAELALWRAKRSGHEINASDNTVAYSDSFLPFPDGAEVLAKADVKIILGTSGSVNDDLVINRCTDLGVTLYLLPDEDARGFAWE